jgi:glycosyltransferase involved in cell wall biosynthesis
MSELRKKSSTTIVLIGPYPPPYGGVSVHIQRLKERLLDAGLKCVVIDVASSSTREDGTVLNPKAILKWFAVLLQETCVIHIHVSGLNRDHNAAKIAALSMLSALTRNKTIVTFHSAAGWVNIGQQSRFRNIVFRTALRGIHHYIAVAAAVREGLKELGVKTERISIVPAFLPPRTRTEDFDAIPRHIWDFIGAHAPVITANAPSTDFFRGEDLYGIDLCIDLCANLRKLYRHHGFIFCIANVTDRDYLNELQQRIIEKRIAENFLFVTQPYTFYPFLTKSDLFVRPTNTDGDAISVREALYFKIPTIASDAAPRPQGATEFANRNLDDLVAKAEQVLRDLTWHKTQLASTEQPDNFTKVVEIYDSVLSGD